MGVTVGAIVAVVAELFGDPPGFAVGVVTGAAVAPIAGYIADWSWP